MLRVHCFKKIPVRGQDQIEVKVCFCVLLQRHGFEHFFSADYSNQAHRFLFIVIRPKNNQNLVCVHAKFRSSSRKTLETLKQPVMFVLKHSTRHVVWRLAQLVIAGIQIVEGQLILSSRKGAWKRWTAPLTVAVAISGAIVEEG